MIMDNLVCTVDIIKKFQAHSLRYIRSVLC